MEADFSERRRELDRRDAELLGRFDDETNRDRVLAVAVLDAPYGLGVDIRRGGEVGRRKAYLKSS